MYVCPSSFKIDTKKSLFFGKDIPQDNLKTLLNNYNEGTKKEKLHLEQAKKEDELKKKENYEKKIREQVLRKEIKSIGIEQLAKAKDRLKLGKALLKLKKMFPNDKTLRKLIIQEFQDTPVAKLPAEYDIFDSDEEDRTKERQGLEPQIVDERISLEELERPGKEKEAQIVSLFNQYLDDFYGEKQTQLRKERQLKAQEVKEGKLMQRFLETKAFQFLELRKKRISQQVPTLAATVSNLYQEICRSEFKAAALKFFPHKRYGENRQTKIKSYPYKFKKHFFQIIRTFIKRKMNKEDKDKRQKLPFWAPSGKSAKSQNDKVKKLSREETMEKELNKRISTNAWDHQEYQHEREQILMCYTDAQECTFQPAIASRLPEKKRQIMRNHKLGYQWLDDYLKGGKTFENWIEKMGTNFLKRYPRIFKFGMLFRCKTFVRQGEYIKAYSRLVEYFKVKQIKQFFDANYETETNNPDSMFNYEKLGIKKEMLDSQKREDFENKANVTFLREVYDLIKFLEDYERSINKQQMHYNNMLSNDPKSNKESRMSMSKMSSNSFQTEKGQVSSYNSRKFQVKDQMCPLGQKCPDAVINRWPHSQIKGNTPLGAFCEYAHTHNELKFGQEIKIKKNLMKNYLKVLGNKLNSNPRPEKWVPGNAVLNDCIGCGEKLGSKGNKGICGGCELRKFNLKKIKDFRELAKKKYAKMTHSTKILDQKHKQQAVDERANKKRGYFRRATILYNLGTLKNSFDRKIF